MIVRVLESVTAMLANVTSAPRVKLMLGVEAWLARAPLMAGSASSSKDMIRSLHHFTGSLVFAASVVLAWQATRHSVNVSAAQEANAS